MDQVINLTENYTCDILILFLIKLILLKKNKSQPHFSVASMELSVTRKVTEIESHWQ